MLIAHVLMTMRWNRSRSVPRAWARAALIGSAWDTHTTSRRGGRRAAGRRRRRCAVCISVKLSPSGKRKRRRVSLHGLPLRAASPASSARRRSSRRSRTRASPASTLTAEPGAGRRSGRPSRGPARAARRRRRRPASSSPIRSATRLSLGHVQRRRGGGPRARPGSTGAGCGGLPVADEQDEGGPAGGFFDGRGP